MPQNMIGKFFKSILSAIKKLTKAEKILFIFLGGLLIISLASLIIFANRSDDKDSFERTITNSALTIITTGIVGTLLALLLKNYEAIQKNQENERVRSQLQASNRDQFRKEILKKLNESYAKTKSARRMLRAKGFTNPYYKQESDDNFLMQYEYDLCMKDINEAQLELEALRDQITNQQSAFSMSDELKHKLKVTDEYLDKLITEYERLRPAFIGSPAKLRIGDLEVMKKFLSQHDEGFMGDFKYSVEGIRQCIRVDIKKYESSLGQSISDGSGTKTTTSPNNTQPQRNV